MKNCSLIVLKLTLFICLVRLELANASGLGILHYSGALADGCNVYGTHGIYQRALTFSQDERFFIYCSADCTYGFNTGLVSRPKTISYRVDAHLLDVTMSNDTPFLLDSVDFAPGGKDYFLLDAGVQASPDSRHAVALTPHRLLIISLASKYTNILEYTNELFGSFAWRDTETLCFSTYDNNGLTFWRVDIQNPNVRQKVYFTKKYAFTSGTGLHAALQKDFWSPNGRYVCFGIVNTSHRVGDAILDVATGNLQELHFSLADLAWTPDSASAFVRAKLDHAEKLLLIDPKSGGAIDISTDTEFQYDVQAASSFNNLKWTPDGTFIVSGPYVFKPRPFKLILHANWPLRWSPIESWLLLQKADKFQWINYSGKIGPGFPRWPDEYSWSSQGHYVALIEQGKIRIVRPMLPLNLHN